MTRMICDRCLDCFSPVDCDPDCTPAGEDWSGLCPSCRDYRLRCMELDAEQEPPSCPYCGTETGLRIACDGYGPIEPEYICEGCFVGSDTGPCFDDLPALSLAKGA